MSLLQHTAGDGSSGQTLNVAYSGLHVLWLIGLIFLMLNLEREHLTLSFIFRLLLEMCSLAFYTCLSNPVVWASQFVFSCLLTVLWFWFKPSHCLPVTMWTYLSQTWNRTNTSSFFGILESLNALSTFYVYFLFPLVTLHVFLYFCAFWKKTLLKEEFYLVKYEWRGGAVKFLTYHV